MRIAVVRRRRRTGPRHVTGGRQARQQHAGTQKRRGSGFQSAPYRGTWKKSCRRLGKLHSRTCRQPVPPLFLFTRRRPAAATAWCRLLGFHGRIESDIIPVWSHFFDHLDGPLCARKLFSKLFFQLADLRLAVFKTPDLLSQLGLSLLQHLHLLFERGNIHAASATSSGHVSSVLVHVICLGEPDTPRQGRARLPSIASQSMRIPAYYTSNSKGPPYSRTDHPYSFALRREPPPRRRLRLARREAENHHSAFKGF